MKVSELLEIADGWEFMIVDNDAHEYSLEESMESIILSVQPSCICGLMMIILDI